jgi:hypothetical protein
MTFDHLAYLVRDTAQSVEALRPFLAEVRLLRKRHELQGAYITYMATSDGGTTIELVEPFEENEGWIEKNEGACLTTFVFGWMTLKPSTNECASMAG